MATQRHAEQVLATPLMETILSEVVREPLPVIGRPRPGIDSPLVQPRLPTVVPVGVPARMGVTAKQRIDSTAAMVPGKIEQPVEIAEAIGIPIPQLQEMEETAWQPMLEAVAAKNSRLTNSQGTSLPLVASAVLLAASAERLYTRYVKGRALRDPNHREASGPIKRRGKQTTARPSPGRGRFPQAKDPGSRNVESDRRTVRGVQKFLAAQKGLAKTVRTSSPFRGGRGGLHVRADKFRDLWRNRRTTRNRTHPSRGGNRATR